MPPFPHRGSADLISPHCTFAHPQTPGGFSPAPSPPPPSPPNPFQGFKCLLIPATLKYADNILYAYAKPASVFITAVATALISGILPRSVATSPWAPNPHSHPRPLGPPNPLSPSNAACRSLGVSLLCSCRCTCTGPRTTDSGFDTDGAGGSRGGGGARMCIQLPRPQGLARGFWCVGCCF